MPPSPRPWPDETGCSSWGRLFARAARLIRPTRSPVQTPVSRAASAPGLVRRAKSPEADAIRLTGSQLLAVSSGHPSPLPHSGVSSESGIDCVGEGAGVGHRPTFLMHTRKVGSWEWAEMVVMSAYPFGMEGISLLPTLYDPTTKCQTGGGSHKPSPVRVSHQNQMVTGRLDQATVPPGVDRRTGTPDRSAAEPRSGRSR